MAVVAVATPPSKPFARMSSSVSVSANTATWGAKALCMSVLCSSDTPGGKLPGVPAPFCLEPCENTELGMVDDGAVGVAVPELGREPDIEVVDSNSFCRDGFDLRYGNEARDEAGEARCFGSIIEFSRWAGYLGSLGVASCGGVMGGSGNAPTGER